MLIPLGLTASAASVPEDPPRDRPRELERLALKPTESGERAPEGFVPLLEVPNVDSGVFLRGQHKSQVNIWSWVIAATRRQC